MSAPDRTSGPFASVVILAAVMGLGLGGCGDDGGSPSDNAPAETSVLLTVVDTLGEPVPGLQVGLANDVSADLAIDHLAAQAGAKPSCRLHLYLPVEVDLLVSIHDVEGDTVQVLFSGNRGAGLMSLFWAGTRRDGAKMPSGHYFARARCRNPETGELLFSAENPMALFMIEPSQYSFGQTDGRGEITIAGRKLFPCFYDLPDQMQYDETGEARGTFNWQEEAFIAVADPDSGLSMSWTRPIVNGRNEFTVVWDPTHATSTARAVEPRTGQPAVPAAPVEDVVIGKQEFSLSGPMPNPFN